MLIVLYGLVVGYVVMQVRLLAQLGGGWRIAAGLPLLISVPALIVSLVGLQQESNLWPLPFLFATPVALVGLAIVGGLYRVRQSQTHIPR